MKEREEKKFQSGLKGRYEASMIPFNLVQQVKFEGGQEYVFILQMVMVTTGMISFMLNQNTNICVVNSSFFKDPKIPQLNFMFKYSIQKQKLYCPHYL